MIPQLFQFGPIPINTFGLSVALGILSAIYILQRSFQRNGINPALADKYAMTGGLVGLLGARLWYLIVFYDDLKHDLASAIFSSAGFIFYGGFILATAVLIIMSRIDKLKLSDFVDSFGPCLTLAYAIGRLGCQLSGDGDYGIETTSLLGMSYSTGVIPTDPGVLVFPTPLYESIACLLILYILLKAEKSEKFRSVPYSRFGLYLFFIGLERFLIEFIRRNEVVFNIFTQAQVIAFFIIAIGLILAGKTLFLRTNQKSVV